MPAMSRDERIAFLREGTRTAKVATTRADGRPHIAPVWFILDGEDVVFTTGADSVKGTTLRRDGRIAMAVDDERPPFSFVTIEGTATLSDDLGELRRWATAIAARYMGDEQAEAFGRRNGVPGELLVRVTPTKIVAQKNITE